MLSTVSVAVGARGETVIRIAEAVDRPVRELSSRLPSVLELAKETVPRPKLVIRKSAPNRVYGVLGVRGATAISPAALVL